MNKITHFTNKVWIVTWEISTGRGCMDYGIYGIFNKQNLANDAVIELKKQHSKPYSNRHSIIKVQEVTLDGSHKLFQYSY